MGTGKNRRQRNVDSCQGVLMKVGVTVMKFRGCFARGCRLPSEAPVLGPGTCALDQHVQWKILALHLNDL
jgi:hypothetical protein